MTSNLDRTHSDHTNAISEKNYLVFLEEFDLGPLEDLLVILLALAGLKRGKPPKERLEVEKPFYGLMVARKIKCLPRSVMGVRHEPTCLVVDVFLGADAELAE